MKKKIGICILAAAVCCAVPFAPQASEAGEQLVGSIAPPGSITPPDSSAEPGTPAEGSFFESLEPEMVTDETLEALMQELRPQLPADNGDWAVYVCDLKNQTESGINHLDHPMQAASLIKLYIMGAVFEEYGALTEQYGQEMIDQNLNAMITVSDNDAANTLVSCLGRGDASAGMSAVNAYCEANGYYSTGMGRLLLQSNEYGDNYTSVVDCGHFLKQIYEADAEESPYADAMYSLLKAQTRRNKIPARMPEGVHIANKTGELSDVENDAGIVYDSQNDLILVFMSEDLNDTGGAQGTIASLSRQIVDYYGCCG